jgi:hypothetical protein
MSEQSEQPEPGKIAIATGLDRMLGFGLKYPTRFKDTHLNRDRHALEAIRYAAANHAVR